MKLLAMLTKLLRSHIFGPSDDAPAAPAEPARRQRNSDWAKIMASSLSASAIDIALQSVHSQLPLTFIFLALAIISAITCAFVSSFIASHYPVPAQVLECLGIFCGLTALFIAIAIPFPLWFRCLIFFVYVVSWCVVLLCNWKYKYPSQPNETSSPSTSILDLEAGQIKPSLLAE